MAAFVNRQRFLVAAIILFMPSALIRRFAFGGSGVVGADSSDSPRIVAYRFRCAIAILRRPAAETLRLRVGACGVAAVCTGPL